MVYIRVEALLFCFHFLSKKRYLASRQRDNYETEQILYGDIVARVRESGSGSISLIAYFLC